MTDFEPEQAVLDAPPFMPNTVAQHNYWALGSPPPLTAPIAEGFNETGRKMYAIDRRCAMEFAGGILLAELVHWWSLVERCDRLEARIKALGALPEPERGGET